MNKIDLCVLLFLACTTTLFAQSTSTKGPVISQYGAVYEVETIDFKTDTTNVLKVVFDVDRTYENQSAPNPLIETAARFLNLHVRNGFPKENLQVALVIHGKASSAILSNEKYEQKFQISNPNAPLIKALDAAGVKIILCGQTAAHRNISKSDTLPEVQWALSAMTALIQLQNNNYRLIKF
ncbi:DsrE family protein [Ascidiimonas sp. W6]|uniref:DsrE family protein n=1 Tax=Ascidiimonas meishanensis TaxID=3128903 RepID=UPI0030EB5B93